MSKRQFWIKMATLGVLVGLGHRAVEVAKTSSNVTHNHHPAPTPTEAASAPVNNS